MIRNKRSIGQFFKIWLRAAVPLVLLGAVAMFLVLMLTLNSLMMLDFSRIQHIGWEEVTILQSHPELLRSEELEESLTRLGNFGIAAILSDMNGQELVRTDLSHYSSEYRSKKGLDYIMEELEKRLQWESVSSTATTLDWFNYSYFVDSVEVYVGSKAYLLIYGGASSVWPDHKGEFQMIGVFLLVILLLFATMIAFSFYRMYLKEVKLEEYYIRTSNAIAHDLKTPLMAASGYAENLLENVHTEKRRYYAEAIINNVERMNRILETILQLSNQDSLKNSMDLQKVDLSKLTEEVLAQHQNLLETKEISLSVSGQAVIKAEPVLMRRVIDNLVGNAVKYTPPRENIRIRISDLEYEIENTGVSIDRRKRHSMWKPFERADAARGKEVISLESDSAETANMSQSAVSGGTGLGLTIVKDILDAHGFSYRLAGDKTRVIVKIHF